MGNQEFDLVMSKVDDIAVAVRKFPESAQGAACTALVSALLLESNDSPNGSTRVNRHQSQGTKFLSANEAKAANRDHVAEIKRDVADYRLSEVSDIEFAAYATRYYTEVGPEHIRVDAITTEELEEAFAIAQRKPPKRFSDTFNNAKKAKEPLLKSGRRQGTFICTAIGRFRVENVLLKFDDQ
ncbi:MAG: hypothetical protein OXN88_10295 [Chloroflexota bacterium]|nr:hypothetical protein [Chloroflexota bacterium]